MVLVESGKILRDPLDMERAKTEPRGKTRHSHTLLATSRSRPCCGPMLLVCALCFLSITVLTSLAVSMLSLLVSHHLDYRFGSFGLAARTQHTRHVMLLQRAQSHNDYDRPRPLADALEAGFCSVEADVFLLGGVLRIGHAENDLGNGTLTGLYLQPLQRLIELNGGWVHRSAARLEVCQSFTLLVDVKSGAEESFEAIERALAPLAQFLRCGINTSLPVVPPLSVVVTGNRPTPAQFGSSRCTTLDARWADLLQWELTPTSPADNQPIYSMLSDKWPWSWEWALHGGVLTNAEVAALGVRVARGHAHGLRLRFWETPTDPTAWTLLVRSGVDIISTDLLRTLTDFLTEADTQAINTWIGTGSPLSDIFRWQ